MTDNLANGYNNVMMNGSSMCDQSGNSGIAVTSSGPMMLPAMTGDKGGESLDGVCRDYMRNVCRRGNNCKFRHPDNYEAEELGKQIEYVFCHDYQVRAEMSHRNETDGRIAEQGMPPGELPICARDESRGGTLPADGKAAATRAE